MARKRPSEWSADELADKAGLKAFHPKNMRSFYAWDGDTLVLNVLGTPSAAADELGEPKGNQLQISVTATPWRGRATRHMTAWLAREVFGVDAAQIDVVFGTMNVNKQLRIRRPARLPDIIAPGACS